MCGYLDSHEPDVKAGLIDEGSGEHLLDHVQVLGFLVSENGGNGTGKKKIQRIRHVNDREKKE